MPTGTAAPDTPKPVTTQTGSTNKPPAVATPPKEGIQVIKPGPGAPAPKATAPPKKK